MNSIAKYIETMIEVLEPFARIHDGLVEAGFARPRTS